MSEPAEPHGIDHDEPELRTASPFALRLASGSLTLRARAPNGAQAPKAEDRSRPIGLRPSRSVHWGSLGLCHRCGDRSVVRSRSPLDPCPLAAGLTGPHSPPGREVSLRGRPSFSGARLASFSRRYKSIAALCSPGCRAPSSHHRVNRVDLRVKSCVRRRLSEVHSPVLGHDDSQP